MLLSEFWPSPFTVSIRPYCMDEPDEISQDIARYCYDWGKQDLQTISDSIRAEKHEVRYRAEDGRHSELFDFSKEDGICYVSIAEDADIEEEYWLVSHTYGYDRVTRPIPQNEIQEQLKDTRESIDNIYDLVWEILDEIRESS